MKQGLVDDGDFGGKLSDPFHHARRRYRLRVPTRGYTPQAVVEAAWRAPGGQGVLVPG
jgi:hypothetical protein